MPPQGRGLKALREAKAAGRGAELILLMLERKPSAFYDCWNELNKGEYKKPVVPPALITGATPPLRGLFAAPRYKCGSCGDRKHLILINGLCETCNNKPTWKELNEEVGNGAYT